MATIGDRVFDNGLGVLNSECNMLTLCTQEPTTYTEARTTYKIADKISPTIATPSDRIGGGREAIIAAITTGGQVTSNGTATHFALIDTANNRLLVVGSLSSSIVLVTSDNFTLDEFTVGIPDPA